MSGAIISGGSGAVYRAALISKPDRREAEAVGFPAGEAAAAIGEEPRRIDRGVDACGFNITDAERA
jgi:hypothetical protein